MSCCFHVGRTDTVTMPPPDHSPPKSSSTLGWFSRLYGRSMSTSITSDTASDRSHSRGNRRRRLSPDTNSMTADDLLSPVYPRSRRRQRVSFWWTSRGTKSDPPPAPPKTPVIGYGEKRRTAISKGRYLGLRKFWERVEAGPKEVEQAYIRKPKERNRALPKKERIQYRDSEVPSLESTDL